MAWYPRRSFPVELPPPAPYLQLGLLFQRDPEGGSCPGGHQGRDAAVAAAAAAAASGMGR